MATSEIRTRTANVNGVSLAVTEAGRAGDPLIVLSHGFPEGAYSWRHQLEPLAAAGYHVIVPDQRGYGHSTVPKNVTDYGIDELTGDLIALIDQAGHEQAIMVGHDWGALIVWDMARIHPERVKAVVGVSVPFTNWPMRPTELFKALMGDRFFYMLYFQQVGPAETEMGRDPHATMRATLWGASGDNYSDEIGPLPPAEGTGWLDIMPAAPAQLPAWLTEADVKHYGDQFAHSGFFGPISYYRNLDANYDRVKDLSPSRLTMPSFFIGGNRDFVVTRNTAAVEAMPTLLPGYRGQVILDGPGHWTQQEDPTGFNAALLWFLKQV
jgi:pimeloyl-ACP methyl ester carboxylesterase